MRSRTHAQRAQVQVSGQRVHDFHAVGVVRTCVLEPYLVAQGYAGGGVALGGDAGGCHLLVVGVVRIQDGLAVLGRFRAGHVGRHGQHARVGLAGGAEAGHLHRTAGRLLRGVARGLVGLEAHHGTGSGHAQHQAVAGRQPVAVVQGQLAVLVKAQGQAVGHGGGGSVAQHEPHLVARLDDALHGYGRPVPGCGRRVAVQRSDGGLGAHRAAAQGRVAAHYRVLNDDDPGRAGR